MAQWHWCSSSSSSSFSSSSFFGTGIYSLLHSVFMSTLIPNMFSYLMVPVIHGSFFFQMQPLLSNGKILVDQDNWDFLLKGLIHWSNWYNTDESLDHHPNHAGGHPATALRVRVLKKGKMNAVRISDLMPKNDPPLITGRRVQPPSPQLSGYVSPQQKFTSSICCKNNNRRVSWSDYSNWVC